MNFTARVENWHIYERMSRSSQKMQKYLFGDFYGHPSMPDGYTTSSSYIVEFHDDYVKTRSGSIYLLGKPKFTQEI